MDIISQYKNLNKSCIGCRFLDTKPWGRFGEETAFICTSTAQEHPQRVLNIVPNHFADRARIYMPEWCHDGWEEK